MYRVGILALGIVLAAAPALAQSYQGQTTRAKPVQGQGANAPRDAVATQPSNSPFANPITQPLPPAVSVNPAQNSNRTTVPLQR